MKLFRVSQRLITELLAGRSRGSVPIALALYTLFFYWKIIFTNRSIFPWDVSDIFYPFLSFVHEELRNFRFPLWDPYAFSGFPIIADPMAQIFYPPNWLMLIARWFYPLSMKLVEIQEIVHYFLAGLFMYWLARDYTKDRFAALLAGVLFMSSGAMVAHAEHLSIINAMAWFPLVFMLARRALLERSYYWTCAAGFFLGMENLAGHWQHSVYLGVLLFLYFFYEACCGPQRRSLWPHWMIQLALIGGIGAGLAMIQIVPTMELSSLSTRTQLAAPHMMGGNSPQYLLTAFLPNYFGGLDGVPYRVQVEPSFNYIFLSVPGCILALLGLIEMARKRNYFWLGLILICTEISFGQFGRLSEAVYRIPVLNLFRHMPMYFNIANFGLCLMAAVGLTTLTSQERSESYLRWLRNALLAALGMAAYLYRWAPEVPDYWQMILALGLFTAVITLWPKAGGWQTAAKWAVLILMTADLTRFGMNQIFNDAPFDPRLHESYSHIYSNAELLPFLRQDTGKDFRVANYMGWPTNQWNLVRIPGTYGWNPLMLRRYQEYTRNINANPDNYRGMESPLQDLLGVKYLLTASAEEDSLNLQQSTKYKKVFENMGWWKVYQNSEYFSRAWLFPRAYVVRDNPAVLALMNSRWFQTRQTLVFEEADVPAESSTMAGAPMVKLHSFHLAAEQSERASTGSLVEDAFCAERKSYWGYWGYTQGDWLRFSIPVSVQAGRYALMVEYGAPLEEIPAMEAEIQQGDKKQTGAATRLLRSASLGCATSRNADLGIFELTTGAGNITLRAAKSTPVNVYSIFLIHLPDESQVAETTMVDNESTDFSFHEFSVSANQFSFRVDAARAGFVLVNEIFYPGWEATIDGQPAEILRADSIFRALPVSAGSHRIEMRFRPRHFWLGASVSLLTLCGLIVFWRMGRRSSGNRSQEANAAGWKADSSLRSE